MTNNGIEQALVDWLLAAGVEAPVTTGSSAEQLSSDSRTVIASVPDVLHVVGPLHKATVHLVVSAPAFHTTLQGYREVVATLRTLVQNHHSNGLAEAMMGAGVQLGGVHVGESTEQVEDARWINTLALTVGLSG